MSLLTWAVLGAGLLLTMVTRTWAYEAGFKAGKIAARENRLKALEAKEQSRTEAKTWAVDYVVISSPKEDEGLLQVQLHDLALRTHIDIGDRLDVESADFQEKFTAVLGVATDRRDTLNEAHGVLAV